MKLAYFEDEKKRRKRGSQPLRTIKLQDITHIYSSSMRTNKMLQANNMAPPTQYVCN